VSSTGLQLALYVLLRPELGAQAANLISMIVSTVANVEANRRWAFGGRGWRDAAGQHARAWAVFLLSLGAGNGALWLLARLAPGAGRAAEVVVLAVANMLSALLRFVLLRAWVFRARSSRPLIGPPPAAQRVMPVWPSE
jgi:putative flippase GtrA